MILFAVNFPHLQHRPSENIRSFENAGGSYMCQHVIDRFNRYFEQRKVQPYYAFEASKIAGKNGFGTNTFCPLFKCQCQRSLVWPFNSQNTYVLARACLERLVEGDAIIVSAQEHEANSGVWRKLAIMVSMFASGLLMLMMVGCNSLTCSYCWTIRSAWSPSLIVPTLLVKLIQCAKSQMQLMMREAFTS